MAVERKYAAPAPLVCAVHHAILVTTTVQGCTAPVSAHTLIFPVGEKITLRQMQTAGMTVKYL